MPMKATNGPVIEKRGIFNLLLPKSGDGPEFISNGLPVDFAFVVNVFVALICLSGRYQWRQPESSLA